MTSEGQIQMEKTVRNLAFNNFLPTEREWMLRRYPHRNVERGEVVFRAGDRGEWYAVVLTGTFIVTLDNDERKTIIATVHAGELIGEAALLEARGVHSATVTAVEDAELLILTRHETLAMAKKAPRIACRFSFNLVGLLSDRMEHMIATIHH